MTTPLDKTGNKEDWFFDACTINLKDGKPLLNSIIHSRICENCKKLPIEKAVTCRHTECKDPDYMSNDKKRKFAEYLNAKSEDQITMTELLGICADPIGKSYSDVCIEKFCNQVFEEDQLHKEDILGVFVMIDPSGGGKSDSAITIGYYNKKKSAFVVIKKENLWMDFFFKNLYLIF
jgi:hypothetical protein